MPLVTLAFAKANQRPPYFCFGQSQITISLPRSFPNEKKNRLKAKENEIAYYKNCSFTVPSKNTLTLIWYWIGCHLLEGEDRRGGGRL